MSSIFLETPRFSLKETVASGLLTAAVWMSSFTFLFPVLVAFKLSSWLRNKWFACFQSFMVKLKRFRNMIYLRKKLFDLIDEHMDEHGQQSIPIRILEIGVGAGENFEFYPENNSLTTVDMNPEFESYLKTTLKKYPKINLENVVIAPVENMSMIKDNQFDVVVATYLMCSVTDVDVAMSEIHRVLKKGGKFALVDHVVFPRRYFSSYMIQQIMAPLWRIYFNGCNLNRNIHAHICASKFSKIHSKTYYPDFMDLLLRPHTMAVCIK